MVIGTPIFGTIADAADSYAPAWMALALWCDIGTGPATRIREARPSEAPAAFSAV